MEVVNKKYRIKYLGRHRNIVYVNMSSQNFSRTISAKILIQNFGIKAVVPSTVGRDLPDLIPVEQGKTIEANYLLVEVPKPNPPYSNLEEMIQRYNIFAVEYDLPLIDYGHFRSPHIFFPYRTLFWFCTDYGIVQNDDRINMTLPVRVVPKVSQQTANSFLLRALFRFRDNRPPIAHVATPDNWLSFFDFVTKPCSAQYAYIPSISSRVSSPYIATVDGMLVYIYSLNAILENPAFLYVFLPPQEWQLIWREIKHVYSIVKEQT